MINEILDRGVTQYGRWAGVQEFRIPYRVMG